MSSLNYGLHWQHVFNLTLGKTFDQYFGHRKNMLKIFFMKKMRQESYNRCLTKLLLNTHKMVWKQKSNIISNWQKLFDFFFSWGHVFSVSHKDDCLTPLPYPKATCHILSFFVTKLRIFGSEELNHMFHRSFDRNILNFFEVACWKQNLDERTLVDTKKVSGTCSQHVKSLELTFGNKNSR